jgi:hypothetical protein
MAELFGRRFESVGSSLEKMNWLNLFIRNGWKNQNTIHSKNLRGVKMKIKIWQIGMTDKEIADLAYWERNVLALKYADGYYLDTQGYQGWGRVLSLEGGKITFHIPDDFDIGNLAQMANNWDGHTTEMKWRRILDDRGVK